MNAFQLLFRVTKAQATAVVALGCLLGIMSPGVQGMSRSSVEGPESKTVFLPVDPTENRQFAASLATDVDNLTVRPTSEIPINSVSIQNGGASVFWYLDADMATRSYFLPTFGNRPNGVADNSFLFRNVADSTRLVWASSQGAVVSGGHCDVKNIEACDISRLNVNVESDPIGIGRARDKNVASEADAGVPEPSSVALVGLALLAAGIVGKRRT